MTDSSHGAVDAESQFPKPRFAQALLCFSGVIVTIAGGLFGLGISLHALMFLCLIWVGLHAAALGHGYLALREMMSAAIARALPAIYIFILIGMVIASFMQAGTIATLMYYGLAWLSPSLFLSVGLILCALMSVATGTSWGTVGTLGVVFIGLGDALGLPLPLVAGMIVCGATFGDKLSPISDTTNLAAMSAGTDLYRHIYSMLFTTVPTFLLALAIFTAFRPGLRRRRTAEQRAGHSARSARLTVRAQSSYHAPATAFARAAKRSQSSRRGRDVGECAASDWNRNFLPRRRARSSAQCPMAEHTG
jgi:Na+/H+ antiporter NhaC